MKFIDGMKFINRILIVLFNICLSAVTLAVPALSMMSSRTYYREQFSATGIYAQVDSNGREHRKVIRFIGGEDGGSATFSDEQLDEIAEHIITYLFGDGESFALVMDNVMLDGRETDGVSIFGDVAVAHMRDVRGLVRFCIAAAVVCGVLTVVLGSYFIWQRRKVGEYILGTSLKFYRRLLLCIGVFCLIAAIGTIELYGNWTPNGFLDILWRDVHYLLFTFQSDKIANSFMNDALVEILTLDLFMTAVFRILVILSCVTGIWLTLCCVMKFAYGRKRRKRSATNPRRRRSIYG